MCCGFETLGDKFRRTFANGTESDVTIKKNNNQEVFPACLLSHVLKVRANYKDYTKVHRGY